nr:unnamed protein product [Callosobruchus chinensis]
MGVHWSTSSLYKLA